MSLRVRYLKLRKRVIPWCAAPGCWNKSAVSPVRIIKGRRWGGRGNVCYVHWFEALQRSLAEEDSHG